MTALQVDAASWITSRSCPIRDVRRSSMMEKGENLKDALSFSKLVSKNFKDALRELNVEVPCVFFKVAVNHWLRSHTEKNDEAKLIHLLSGFEALFRTSDESIIKSKEVAMGVPKLIEKFDKSLAQKSKYIIWDSYGEKNNFCHGKLININKIRKLVPKLQVLLKIAIDHQLNTALGLPSSHPLEYKDLEMTNDG